MESPLVLALDTDELAQAVAWSRAAGEAAGMVKVGLELFGAAGPPPAAQAVPRLADLAVRSGCQAIVCSPLEAAALRARLGPAVELVCPGVRPAEAEGLHDQVRVATPAQAMAAGATRIVVGRPITRADDVGAAARAVRDQAVAGRPAAGRDERANRPKALDAHGRFDGL